MERQYVKDKLKCIMQARVKKMVKIAVDMMGGDEAPDNIIEAVKNAVNDFPDLEILLFGDEKKYNFEHERITFTHTDEKIRSEERRVGKECRSQMLPY